MMQISKELLNQVIKEIEDYEELVEADRGLGRSIEQLEEQGNLPEVLVKLRELRDNIQIDNAPRQSVLEEVAQWYESEGYLLDEQDVSDAIRKLGSK